MSSNICRTSKLSKCSSLNRFDIQPVEPYKDGNFHHPFNPPPNEINFIGGLGKRTGNRRSTLHPTRPTIVQQIFNMRHRNKIDIHFSQPAKQQHSCLTRKSHSKSTAQKCLPTSMNEIYRSFAVRTASTSKDTSASQSVVTVDHTKSTTKLSRQFSGYLYGKLNGMTSPDPYTLTTDNYGVPLTMHERVHAEQKRQRIEASVLRRMRLNQMGHPQPPSTDESDNENEAVANVKRLALIRTPYFSLPTIRMRTINQKRTIANKYLKKDRLRRVTRLFYDRDQPTVGDTLVDGSAVKHKVKSGEGGVRVLSTEADFMTAPIGVDSGNNMPQMRRYNQIIRDKFLEHWKRCRFDDSLMRRPTFEEFKEQLNTKKTHSNQIVSLVRALGEKMQQMRLQADKKTTPELVLQRRRHKCYVKSDNVAGPAYMDPYLFQKMKTNDDKVNAPQKFYLSLLKSKQSVRERLQVNVTDFEHEKCGVGVKYFHRLATDIDDYFIHELRYKPNHTQFRFKTDIQEIRNMTLSNYIMYYIQEQLMKVRAKNRSEQNAMKEYKQHLKICSLILDEWKSTALCRITTKKEVLESLRSENVSLEVTLNELTNTEYVLSEKVFDLERNWDESIAVLNYYHLVMDSQWRNAHDWIHRDENGVLLDPLVAVKNCAVLFTRQDKIVCVKAVRSFFKKEVFVLADKINSTQPDIERLEKCLSKLKSNTFMCLSNLNKTIWDQQSTLLINRNLGRKIASIQHEYKKWINSKAARQNFMREREEALKRCVQTTLNHHLLPAVKHKDRAKAIAMCGKLYDRIIPKTSVPTSTNTAIKDPLMQFLEVQSYIKMLLEKLDQLPTDTLIEMERLARSDNQCLLKESKIAMVQQKRFNLLRNQLQEQFKPPRRFKRFTGRYPIKKKVVSKVQSQLDVP